MTDPFELLGLDPRFDLDLSDLQQRFLAAAAEHHPDRYTDPLDQADAAERIAATNAAFQTLRNPESRANALLARLGGPAKEDDNSLPPTLLMEVMEVREQLEQAVADDNAAELDRLRAWADQQRQAHLDQLSKLFSEDPVTTKTIRLELNALRYTERMLEQMPG